jgi:hypothetical protein
MQSCEIAYSTCSVVVPITANLRELGLFKNEKPGIMQNSLAASSQNVDPILRNV